MWALKMHIIHFILHFTANIATSYSTLPRSYGSTKTQTNLQYGSLRRPKLHIDYHDIRNDLKYLDQLEESLGLSQKNLETHPQVDDYDMDIEKTELSHNEKHKYSLLLPQSITSNPMSEIPYNTYGYHIPPHQPIHRKDQHESKQKPNYVSTNLAVKDHKTAGIQNRGVITDKHQSTGVKSVCTTEVNVVCSPKVNVSELIENFGRKQEDYISLSNRAIHNNKIFPHDRNYSFVHKNQKIAFAKKEYEPGVILPRGMIPVDMIILEPKFCQNSSQKLK